MVDLGILKRLNSNLECGKIKKRLEVRVGAQSMANVLIIDDDKAMCDRIANAVVRLGQKSACARTLGEGLRKVLAESFAVIFLEAQMPDIIGIIGLGTLKKIKGGQ